MRPHQRLDLWTRSVDFVVEIYRVTEKFPKEQKFGLTPNYAVRRFRSQPMLPRVLQKLRGRIS